MLVLPRPKKRLDWSETAWREFIDGIAFIAEDSPQGASLVRTRIDRAAGFVHSHPRMGKPGAVAGTREYPVPSTRYTLIYEERAAIARLHKLSKGVGLGNIRLRDLIEEGRKS